MIAVTKATGPLCAHGEGPVWDPDERAVRWVDMIEGTVHRLDPSGDAAPTSVRIGPWAAALRRRAGGGWVVATRDGFLLTDAGLGVEREIRAFDDPTRRMNDGGCTGDGAFLCGTAGPEGRGFLYRLDPSGDVSVVSAGITVSNGLAADPAGDGVFYIDTPTRRVDRLHLVDGVLREREPFSDLSGLDGLPDGLAVDAEGGVWVAMWGAGAVIRLDAEGRPDARIELPTPHVSACAFGGENLDELFITTSRQDLAQPDPDAGSLFRATPGVCGATEPHFRG